MSVFMPVPYWKYESSNSVFFKDCFSYLQSLESLYEFTNENFYFYKNIFKVLIGIIFDSIDQFG